MVWIMYAMFAFILLVLIFVIVIFAKAGKHKNANAGTAGTYDVFEISDTHLTVLAGIPVTYEIEEIENITFSASKAPRSSSIYNGIIRVIKIDGKKSRPFMFNSSAYKKKSVFVSSKPEIEQTIQYLMDELKQHHIPCSRIA